MDKDRLQGYLDQGLSLMQIGALENRDPSTVGYWVKKHGLVACRKEMHTARGALPRDALQELVDSGATLREIATTVHRSPSTVRYWLRRYGLRTRNRRGPRPTYDRVDLDQAVDSGVRSVTAGCHVHGVTEFGISDGKRRRVFCKQCRAEAVARRRRKVKEILVREAGGRCQLCGYDRSVRALHFHHRDPREKAFG